MLQWALVNTNDSKLANDQLVFFKLGKTKLKGVAGESLLSAVARALTSTKPSHNLNWIFSDKGLVEFETILKDGSIFKAPLEHFQVEEGRQFAPVKPDPDLELAQVSRNAGRRHLSDFFQSFWKQLNNKSPKQIRQTPSAPEVINADIVIIGGGKWGCGLAAALSAMGKKIALMHHGAIENPNSSSFLSFGNCGVLDVDSSGAVYGLQRQDYETGKVICVEANIVVFATGVYESRFPLSAEQPTPHLSLACLEKLNSQMGIKPIGTLIASVSYEAAFKRVLALHDRGVRFDMMADVRPKLSIANIDIAMSHGLRVSTDTIPFKYEVEDKQHKLTLKGTHDVDDKFAKSYPLDALISSQGYEPYGSLFWRSGGNYVPAFAGEKHVVGVATRLETGIWLLPVGGLAGAFGCTPQEIDASAQEIIELCDNKRRRKTSLSDIIAPNKENYAHLMEPAKSNQFELGKAQKAIENNNPIELLNLKLRQPDLLHEASESAKQACGAHTAQGLNLGISLKSTIAFEGDQPRLELPADQNKTYRTIKGKRVLYKANTSFAGTTFTNVAGVLLPERFEGDIVLLATEDAMNEDLRSYFLRSENLAKNGKSGMMLFRIKDKRNVRAVQKEMAKNNIPCIGFYEMATVALQKNEMRFFQMFSEHVFGLNRRKLARYKIDKAGAAPEAGDVLYADAHAKKQLGIVLHAQKTNNAGLVVYPLGASLPAALYHRGINQVYIHQEI